MAMRFSFDAVTHLAASFVFYGLCTSVCWAVDCTPKAIGLWNQASVDNFQAEHGPCDRLATLEIEGDDIVNLNGLGDLVEVSRNLTILNNPALIDISGLSSVATVGNSLWIQNNDALTRLDAFSAISVVGGVLAVIYNDKLENLDGFSSLERTGGTLSVSNNASLENVDGLASLTTVGFTEDFHQGWVNINHNPSLTDLDGLSGLVSVGNMRILSGLTVQDNASLVDISGLSTLEAVWGDIMIGDNPILTSIDCFGSLERAFGLSIYRNASLGGIEGPGSMTRLGSLIIDDNDALTGVRGFNALSEMSDLGVTGNDVLPDMDSFESLISVENRLQIYSNASLGQCGALTPLVDPIDDGEPGPGNGAVPDVGGEIIIAGNRSGCESVAAILATAPLSYINAGLSDAWFYPATNGQGFFIHVFPQIRQVFLGWFTYDTERPPDDVTAILGEPGHRWITAQGEFLENEALLEIWVTEGGIFDSELPKPTRHSDGEILLEFSTCNAGTVAYDIPSIGLQGFVPIERITLDNVPLCYRLNAEAEYEAVQTTSQP
jgi:hypothetical protein